MEGDYGMLSEQQHGLVRSTSSVARGMGYDGGDYFVHVVGVHAVHAVHGMRGFSENIWK